MAKLTNPKKLTTNSKIIYTALFVGLVFFIGSLTLAAGWPLWFASILSLSIAGMKLGSIFFAIQATTPLQIIAAATTLITFGVLSLGLGLNAIFKNIRFYSNKFSTRPIATINTDALIQSGSTSPVLSQLSSKQKDAVHKGPAKKRGIFLMGEDVSFPTISQPAPITNRRSFLNKPVDPHCKYVENILLPFIYNKKEVLKSTKEPNTPWTTDKSISYFTKQEEVQPPAICEVGGLSRALK